MKLLWSAFLAFLLNVPLGGSDAFANDGWMSWRVDCAPEAFNGRGRSAHDHLMKFTDVVVREGIEKLERINASAACQVKDGLMKRPFVLKCQGRTSGGSAVTVPRVSGALGVSAYKSNIIVPRVVAALLSQTSTADFSRLQTAEIAAAKNLLFHEILHAVRVENKGTRDHNRVYVTKTMEDDVTYACANVIFPDPRVEACLRKQDGSKCYSRTKMCNTCASYEAVSKACRGAVSAVSVNSSQVGCGGIEHEPARPPAGWPEAHGPGNGGSTATLAE